MPKGRPTNVTEERDRATMRLRPIGLVVIALLALHLGLSVAAADPPDGRILTEADMIRALTALDQLPYLDIGTRCVQASSYDRNSTIDPDTGSSSTGARTVTRGST